MRKKNKNNGKKQTKMMRKKCKNHWPMTAVRGRRMSGAGGRQLPHQCNVKWQSWSQEKVKKEQEQKQEQEPVKNRNLKEQKPVKNIG